MSQHRLTQDPWTVETVTEFGRIPLAALTRMERTHDAIQAIARLVGNSARETDSGPDAASHTDDGEVLALDAWTVAALMGGLESLCDHLHQLAERMWQSAETETAPAQGPPQRQHVVSVVASPTHAAQ